MTGCKNSFFYSKKVALFFIFSPLFSFSQRDTVIGKHSYNHIEFYENGNIKLMGNIEDSVKTGKWYFYQPNGNLLAKGKFCNGIAKGKWVYHDYGVLRTYNWKWSKGFKPVTVFVIQNEKAILKQTIYWDHGVVRFFENGKRTGGMKW